MLTGFYSEIKGAVSNNKAFHNENSNSLLSPPVSDTSSCLTSQHNDPNLTLWENNYNRFPVIIVEFVIHNKFNGLLQISPIVQRVKLFFGLIQLINACVLHFYTT